MKIPNKFMFSYKLSLNAEHDSKENGCDDVNDFPYLMNSHLSESSTNFIWSPCSQDSITEFLE
jgi:hypothetical protein